MSKKSDRADHSFQIRAHHGIKTKTGLNKRYIEPFPKLFYTWNIILFWRGIWFSSCDAGGRIIFFTNRKANIRHGMGLEKAQMEFIIMQLKKNNSLCESDNKKLGDTLVI